jgi:hypothetical protein
MEDRNSPTPRIKGAPAAPRDAAHEARRAEALRANLRRRKAGVSSAAASSSAGER